MQNTEDRRQNSDNRRKTEYRRKEIGSSGYEEVETRSSGDQGFNNEYRRANLCEPVFIRVEHAKRKTKPISFVLRIA